MKTLSITVGLFAFALVLSGCSLLPSSTEPTATSIPESEIITTDETTQLTENDDADLLTQIGNATINVPGSDPLITIQMVNGSGDVVEGTQRANVVLTPPYAKSDVYPDGSVDALVIANFNMGGSGDSQYVALFKNDGTALVQTSDILIGNRIQITGLRIEANPVVNPTAYSLMVDYLDRTPDQAMVEAPTVPTTKTIQVVDHSIVGGNQY